MLQATGRNSDSTMPEFLAVADYGIAIINTSTRSVAHSLNYLSGHSSADRYIGDEIQEPSTENRFVNLLAKL